MSSVLQQAADDCYNDGDDDVDSSGQYLDWTMYKALF